MTAVQCSPSRAAHGLSCGVDEWDERCDISVEGSQLRCVRACVRAHAHVHVRGRVQTLQTLCRGTYALGEMKLSGHMGLIRPAARCQACN